MSNFDFKQLKGANTVVTGGSRDIGGGIVAELVRGGAKVEAVFRSHGDRAQKIVDSLKGVGSAPILLQADLTTDEGKKALFESWSKNFDNQIDNLVLCASGATMEINVDANMALVDKFIELRQEMIKKGEKLGGGTIIFLQSEPGHFQKVIDNVFDFIEYYRDKVGPAKRAGEDALRKRLPLIAEAGLRAIVVCPPEVTDTFNMKLFELQNKEARLKSRELSAMIGTRAFVTIEEVAKRVKTLIEDDGVLNGHTELFDKSIDSLSMLATIYGECAVYLHTFNKSNGGQGRVIVNSALWKREEEPSFAGEILGKTDNEIKTSLGVTDEHMRGHFRDDIAHLFPGHKSIRTAGITLARFINGDSRFEEKDYVLRKYSSVKFRSPVLPGQRLVSEVRLSEKSALGVVGDAKQKVNEKESMEIYGMFVEKKAENEESVLLLDQLVETAAQAIGVYLLDDLKGEELLPLFHSTGAAELFKNIKNGDSLIVMTKNVKLVKMNSMNIFSGDVDIYRGEVSQNKDGQSSELKQGGKLASILSLSGVLLPKMEMLKKLK